jgi:hypothetical protein
MAQWKEANPNNNWMQAEVEAHQILAPADNSKLVGTGQSSTYGTVTKQDVEVWKNETYKTAVYGSPVFHSGDELGSEIAVSCDMCHPRAANTHPESYPKFQSQLGRVALLRDMINWFIEHPVRGARIWARLNSRAICRPLERNSSTIRRPACSNSFLSVACLTPLCMLDMRKYDVSLFTCRAASRE